MLFSCISSMASISNAQSTQMLTTETIEQEIQGSSIHSYKVSLNEGDFVKIVVLQKGIDAVVTVFNPSGTKELQVDTPNGTQGIELVSFVASSDGNYRLTVTPLEAKAPAGKYEIRVISKLNAEEYKKSQPVTIKTGPTDIYIEKGEGAQYINFEFLIQNAGNDTLTIESIALSVRNKNGQLTLKKFINGNGVVPGISTIANRILSGQSQLTVFNPFHTFESELDLSDLSYGFTFSSQIGEMYEVTVAVKPSAYVNKTKLRIPLKGKILIEDGHDFYAHHRRFDYGHPFLQSLGFKTNFMRYSYDFVTLNANDEMFSGNEQANDSWDCFGKSIYAPAAGKVVAVIDSMRDNRKFDERLIAQNQMILFGNHIVIDHLNGEYSLFAHIQKGSAKVRIGDMVSADQAIAAIGASGSANIPHLHYELRTSADHLAEGLPSYFTNYKKSGKKVSSGQLDSGDIVEN